MWRRSPAAPIQAEGESGGVTGTSHGFGYDNVRAVKFDAAGAIECQQLLNGSHSDYGCEIEPMAAFDCNGNGRIDFTDVVWLFTHL